MKKILFIILYVLPFLLFSQNKQYEDYRYYSIDSILRYEESLENSLKLSKEIRLNYILMVFVDDENYVKRLLVLTNRNNSKENYSKYFIDVLPLTHKHRKLISYDIYGDNKMILFFTGEEKGTFEIYDETHFREWLYIESKSGAYLSRLK